MKMPKVKKGKRYKKSYNEDIMQRALNEIRQSGSIRTVSSKYGIPRSTLQYRLSTNFKKTACGPSPVLTLDEERNIKQWIITCEKRGFPVDKETVRATVKRLLDKNNRNTIFKNNCPGNGWYRAFLRRHPELFPPTSEGARRSSRISGKNWTYWHVYEYLKAIECEDILNDPQRVYKTDETNFQICPKTSKILFHEYEGIEAKTTISVMHMFSAIGKCTPPVLVFPYRKMLMDMRQALPNKWGAGISGLGYVNSNILYDYVSCILRPHLAQEKIKLPIVLFVEDRTAYFSYELFDLCNKCKVILISLTPNANTGHNKVVRAQSANSNFRPLKSGWAKAVAQRKINNSNNLITKDHILPILQNIVANITPASIKNGLKTDGICPWIAQTNFNDSLTNGINNTISSIEKKPIKNIINSEVEHEVKPIIIQRPTSQRSTIQRSIKLQNRPKFTEPPPVLEFEKFKKLIGSEKLRKLQSIHVSNENSDFRILQKIYNHFARIDVLLNNEKNDNSINPNNNYTNGIHSDDEHIVAEHISLPELIKAEPLDFEFENEGDSHDGFYQEDNEVDMMNNDIGIKNEYPELG